MTRRTKVKDISHNPPEQLVVIKAEELMPLPCDQSNSNGNPPVRSLTEEQKSKYECSLDGMSALLLPKPQSKEEEDKLVAGFLSGLKKLLSKDNNWTFLQPLTISLEYCAKCQLCSDECPIYVGSLPTFLALRGTAANLQAVYKGREKVLILVRWKRR